MLDALGIDETFFFQMGIFISVLIFLSEFVFKPYSQAYEIRRKILNPDENEEFKALKGDSKKRKDLYEKMVHDLHKKCQSFYVQKEKEALLEKENILERALKESKLKKEKSNKNLKLEMEVHLEKLTYHAGVLSKVVLDKILRTKKELKNNS